MKKELNLKSIEAQLDRVETQLEFAQSTINELKVSLLEAMLRDIKNGNLIRKSSKK